jgi:hypothetical protein
LPQTQHQRGGAAGGWQVKAAGGLFGGAVGGSGRVLVLEAAAALAAGEAVAMDYAPDKSDGQVLVDHGVLDPLVNQVRATSPPTASAGA